MESDGVINTGNASTHHRTKQIGEVAMLARAHIGMESIPKMPSFHTSLRYSFLGRGIVLGVRHGSFPADCRNAALDVAEK